jgi:hypothetical protein
MTVSAVKASSRHSAAGLEVTAGATVGEGYPRGLRKVRDARIQHVARVVAYDGTATIRFCDGLFAVPVCRLWETA